MKLTEEITSVWAGVLSVLNHHGFKSEKSCLSSLISFYDKITHLTDQGKPADVIF